MLESLFDTGGKRAAGWVVVLAIALWWAVGYWNAGPKYRALDPTAEELKQLAAMTEEEYSNWLSEFFQKKDDGQTPLQMLIVQAVPNEAPIVLASPKGSSEEEESTHWRCPWTAVTKALAQPLSGSKVVEGEHAGVDYLHHIHSFDDTGTRCLLINQMAPPKGFGLRNALGIAAVLLGVALIASRDS